MEEKGFTLVELLAVIAILAILVIMALPAVLNMFTQARIDTFENEVKTIYRTAQQNYLLNGGAAVSYGSSGATGCTTPLDMTGNNKLHYSVKIDGSGKVTSLIVNNETYGYSNTNAAGFNIEDIDVGTSATIKTAAQATPSCN